MKTKFKLLKKGRRNTNADIDFKTNTLLNNSLLGNINGGNMLCINRTIWLCNVGGSRLEFDSHCGIKTKGDKTCINYERS